MKKEFKALEDKPGKPFVSQQNAFKILKTNLYTRCDEDEIEIYLEDASKSAEGLINYERLL